MFDFLIFRPIALVVGYLYPSYCSFKALQTPSDDDDKQWLTYWIVMAFFTGVESLLDLCTAHLTLSLPQYPH